MILYVSVTYLTGFFKKQGTSIFAIVNSECPISPIRRDKVTIIFVYAGFSTRRPRLFSDVISGLKCNLRQTVISIMEFLSFMFTLAISTILNGYTQVNIKILLIQSYHTTCVSFSCEFMSKSVSPESICMGIYR